MPVSGLFYKADSGVCSSFYLSLHTRCQAPSDSDYEKLCGIPVRQKPGNTKGVSNRASLSASNPPLLPSNPVLGHKCPNSGRFLWEWEQLLMAFTDRVWWQTFKCRIFWCQQCILQTTSETKAEGKISWHSLLRHCSECPNTVSQGRSSPTLIQLPANAPSEVAGNDSSVWVSATHRGDLAYALGSWLRPGPAKAILRTDSTEGAEKHCSLLLLLMRHLKQNETQRWTGIFCTSSERG